MLSKLDIVSRVSYGFKEHLFEFSGGFSTMRLPINKIAATILKTPSKYYFNFKVSNDSKISFHDPASSILST